MAPPAGRGVAQPHLNLPFPLYPLQVPGPRSVCRHSPTHSPPAHIPLTSVMPPRQSAKPGAKPARPLPAVGAGPIKRTPHGPFDRVAADTSQTYIVEKIHGCRPHRYDTSGSVIIDWIYFIGWGGPWSRMSAANTWEPTSNLDGCDAMMEEARQAHDAGGGG